MSRKRLTEQLALQWGQSHNAGTGSNLGKKFVAAGLQQIFFRNLALFGLSHASVLESLTRGVVYSVGIPVLVVQWTGPTEDVASGNGWACVNA
jgi:hypothetical protein